MPRLRKISKEEFDRTSERGDDLPGAGARPQEPVARQASERFPHLAAWIRDRGWIELGADEHSASAIRILDTGGMVWESLDDYDTVDAALAAADRALADLAAHGEL